MRYVHLDIIKHSVGNDDRDGENKKRKKKDKIRKGKNEYNIIRPARFLYNNARVRTTNIGEREGRREGGGNFRKSVRFKRYQEAPPRLPGRLLCRINFE